MRSNRRSPHGQTGRPACAAGRQGRRHDGHDRPSAIAAMVVLFLMTFGWNATRADMTASGIARAT
jgi:hypothetical protein